MNVVKWETLHGTEAACQLAQEVAGINVQNVALHAGVNRTSFYRKLLTTFETTVLLVESERDAAFSFIMSALMFGLSNRERLRRAAGGCQA